MAFRVSPLYWPTVAATWPVLAPFLLVKSRRFTENVTESRRRNSERLEKARPMDLPELESLELIVLGEQEKEPGFHGEPGVSYVLKSDKGALLLDIGFGSDSGCVAFNADKLGFKLGDVDAVVISHLHVDHMGGMQAARQNKVMVPAELGDPGGMTCFLPDQSTAEGFDYKVVDSPQELAGGIFSTGPLARAMFFMGLCEEQVLLARLKDKGLVIVTGCGHPTMEPIMRMVRKISEEPVYAIIGGLHMPLTKSRISKAGLQFQMFMGTGKPPWQKITNIDLGKTIAVINNVTPKRVLVSAHDSCDKAIERMSREIEAEVDVLKAGAQYQI